MAGKQTNKTFKHVDHVFGESKNLAHSPAPVTDPWIKSHLPKTQNAPRVGAFSSQLKIHCRVNPQNDKQYQLLWINDKKSHGYNRQTNWFAFIQLVDKQVVDSFVDRLAKIVHQYGVVRKKNKYTIMPLYILEDAEINGRNIDQLLSPVDYHQLLIDNFIGKTLAPGDVIEDMKLFKDHTGRRELSIRDFQNELHELIYSMAVHQVKVVEDLISSTYVEPTPVKPVKPDGKAVLKNHIINKDIERITRLCTKLKVSPVDYLNTLRDVVTDPTLTIPQSVSVTIVE